VKSKSLDQRIIPLLRLSIIVQILFFLSSFFPLRNPFRPEPHFEVDYWSFIPVLLMVVILASLFVPRVQKKISKNAILVILFAQAIVTILSRYIFSFSPERGIFSPTIGFTRLDMIIFIIIPLVFLAWQYQFKYVILYCVLVTFIDIIPTAYFSNGNWFQLVVLSLGTISRGVILGIVGWIEYRLVELQRSQQVQLEESNRKLRRYAYTAERLAQSQERNRLARELHDTLAHTLSSVAVQLEAVKALFDIKPRESKGLLDKTLENTRNGLKETRRALKDLRASELVNYGLTRAITNLLVNGKERSGFNYTSKIAAGIDDLSDEITHCLYRSVQEAVENIVRHSNAKKVVLELNLNNGKIHLKITDDGEGFDNIDAKEKNKFGIKGIRERVEALGGTFKINSRRDTGTVLEVILERENG
jgi:signal transduction histidine kinase